MAVKSYFDKHFSINCSHYIASISSNDPLVCKSEQIYILQLSTSEAALVCTMQ